MWSTGFLSCPFGFTLYSQYTKTYGKRLAENKKSHINISTKEMHILSKFASCEWVRECFNTDEIRRFGNPIYDCKYQLGRSNDQPIDFLFVQAQMNSVCKRIGCHINTLLWIILNIWNLLAAHTLYTLFLFIAIRFFHLKKKWPASSTESV